MHTFVYIMNVCPKRITFKTNESATMINVEGLNESIVPDIL